MTTEETKGCRAEADDLLAKIRKGEGRPSDAARFHELQGILIRATASPRTPADLPGPAPGD